MSTAVEPWVELYLVLRLSYMICLWYVHIVQGMPRGGRGRGGRRGRGDANRKLARATNTNLPAIIMTRDRILSTSFSDILGHDSTRAYTYIMLWYLYHMVPGESLHRLPSWFSRAKLDPYFIWHTPRCRALIECNREHLSERRNVFNYAQNLPLGTEDSVIWYHLALPWAQTQPQLYSCRHA